MELLKYGGLLLEIRHLHLINMCSLGGKNVLIPRRMEVAIVKPLFKKGDRNDCSKYRDISLLTSGYKLYTSDITERIKPKVDPSLTKAKMVLGKDALVRTAHLHSKCLCLNE